MGENGELRFSTSSTTKIDVTDMANAQARLIANRELDKGKFAHKKGKIGWIVGTAVGRYLLMG